MVRTARLLNINTFVNLPRPNPESQREKEKQIERERFGIYLENLPAFHKRL